MEFLDRWLWLLCWGTGTPRLVALKRTGTSISSNVEETPSICPSDSKRPVYPPSENALRFKCEYQ